MAAELGSAAVSGVASKVAEGWFDFIKREVSYVFKYQSYIDDLKKQLKKLEGQRQMVEKPVDQAKRQGDEIYMSVENWLNSVDAFTENVAKPITGSEDEAKKRCFKGLCPNLFKRYSLSKKAVKAEKQGADLLINGIFNNVSYRPAGDLERQVEDLKFLRQRVEKDIELAESQGEEIFEDVKLWLIRVKDFDEKAVNAAEEIGNLLRKGNFTNVSYRPAGDLKREVEELKFVRQRVEKDIERAESQGEEIFEDVKFWLIRVKDFDEKAVNAAEEIGNLLSKGNFTNVSYRPALEKTELVRARGYEQFDSRLKVFQDVMEALNDSNVDMIGVYGMGGVGKTTLVKQVARKVIEDKLFDEVAMAEVTQTPDYRKIQDKIARDLGLEFGQEESIVRRADRLRVRLKKEKTVLIILDNIWTKFEFDDVGIPFRDDENQRKNDERRCTIILTSRSRELLSNDMNSLKNFPIEVLSNREAEQLFEKIVGDSARQSDFQRIGHEIVERCGGLPVALNTIANALKNKSLLIWNDALDQIRNSNPREIHGMDANVYSSIELSYNYLESDEAKHLFLLCSLLRACDSLYFSYLLRYGMGLGLFKNVRSLTSARYRVHKLIDSLKASCLLLDGDAENEIKMHDIIFAVAVSIAEEKLMFSIQNISDLKEERINKDSTAISVPYKIQELPEERLEFPQLKFLLLRAEYGSSLQIPDFLFEGMKQLKVLDCTAFCFPSLPSSLGCLINLQTLCLESCQLQDIAMVGQLKKLEILSFRDSNIEQLPTEIGQLRHLQLLDLTNCKSLEVIPPNVISKLSGLEELYMGDSFTKWEKEGGGGNACLVELKGLSKLTTLDIHIPSAEIIPQDLVSVELKRFWISVGKERGLHDIYKTSRFMKIGRLEKITFLEMLLKRTEHLFLEELKLDSLTCMENIWHNQFQYQNLKKVTLTDCKRLKYMFSNSMVNSLVQLVHLDICRCPSMEAVVVDTTSTGLRKDEGKLIEMVFPKLAYLSFSCLPKLTSFAIGMPIHSIEFPSLLELTILSCPNLRRFISMSTLDDKILTETRPRHFFDEKVALPNLMKLGVAWCNGWRSLMTLSMAQSMVKLTRMVITDCEKMEEIIQQDLGEEVKDDRIVFGQLKYLQFGNLTSLKSFCLGNYTLEFSSLEQVYVRKCQNMKTFSQGVLFTPKLHNVIVGSYPENEGYWEGNLNSTIQKMFKEMVGFRDTWNLRLSLHSHLKEMWHNQELPVSYFNKLRYLEVDGCTDMSSAIPMNVLPCLNNLKSLRVNNCDSIEDVFHLEELNIDEHFGPLLPKLKHLRLTNLPKLQRFCNFTGKIIELPSLSFLWIENSPNMEVFVSNPTSAHITESKEPQEMKLEENFLIDDIQPFFNENVAIPCLKELKLLTMPKLLRLLKERLECSKLARSWVSFQNMTTLEVSSSEGLMSLAAAESVVRLIIREMTQHVGEEVKTDIVLVFVHLKYLKLHRLPSLVSFCMGNYILEFPSSLQVIFS